MILKVENISKSFRKKTVLSCVSFELEKGKMYGIVGENGSGKSTLLKIIVGEWKADRGKISLYGKFGYCPQQATLFSDLTIEENFLIFGLAYGLSNSAIIEVSKELMEKFNFTKFKAERDNNLSGGTQQKLNLSISLMNKPDLLILDEPYNGFDRETYLLFWDYTNYLTTNGCTILIVTHLLSETSSFSKILDLSGGTLK